MMQKIAKFHKVSEQQFVRDWCAACHSNAAIAQRLYEALKLPCRATAGSAGYDFFAPESFVLSPHETITVPTGVRVKLAEGWVLQMFPRSGLGFKYRLQMNNTVGIIDSDYYDADNEGHIFIKLTNDTNEGKTLSVTAGDAFAQGVFTAFGITVDDEATAERHGGLGSTSQ